MHLIQEAADPVTETLPLVILAEIAADIVHLEITEALIPDARVIAILILVRTTGIILQEIAEVINLQVLQDHILLAQEEGPLV